MTTAPATTLLDGTSLPQLGFGTWPMDDDDANPRCPRRWGSATG
jgi:diketogulonate reductase-like aldo/keto reductase